jgi:hypothetical protein
MIASLDLRSGRRTALHVDGTVQGVAPSPDLRWVAYATATPRGVAESKLLRVGKGARPLRGDSSIAPQAFAPDSSALVYTSVYDGPPYVFAATTACPGRCARRLGLGRQAAWEP